MTHSEYVEADTVTFEVDSTSAAISEYDAVRLTGEGVVSATDATGQSILGVAAKAPSVGPTGTERVSVHLRQIRNANVGTGTAGGDLVTSGTVGQLREKNTSGATGESATPGGSFKLLRSADADGLGQMLIR